MGGFEDAARSRNPCTRSHARWLRSCHLLLCLPHPAACILSSVPADGNMARCHAPCMGHVHVRRLGCVPAAAQAAGVFTQCVAGGWQHPGHECDMQQHGSTACEDGGERHLAQCMGVVKLKRCPACCNCNCLQRVRCAASMCEIAPRCMVLHHACLYDAQGEDGSQYAEGSTTWTMALAAGGTESMSTVTRARNLPVSTSVVLVMV